MKEILNFLESMQAIYKQQSPHFQIQFSTHQRKISYYFFIYISKPNKQTGHNSLTNEMLGNSRFVLFQVFYFTSRPYRCGRDFLSTPTGLKTPTSTHSALLQCCGRILILVRQPDPHFTPRVRLVPIVHCQGVIDERKAMNSLCT